MSAVKFGKVWRLVDFLKITASLVCVTGVASSASGMPVDTAITRAKLVYVDDRAMFRTQLDEHRLAQAGCTYSSHDPKAMRTLRHVLDASNFDNASDGIKMIEPRFALYFEQEDGSTHALLLDRQYNGSSARHGTLDGKPVSVISNVVSQLAQWAVDANIPQTNDRCTSPYPAKLPIS